MSTINPVVTPQPQSMAFKGKNKKVFDALEKLTNTMPDEALKQAALKDIREPVSEEAYASAHKKAAKILDTLKNGKLDFKVVDDSVFKSYKELSTEDKKILKEAYIKDVLGYFKIKKLSTEQATLERINGMTAASQIHNKEELKNLIMREALMGNKDFLQGVNDYLATDAAKDIYKK